MDAYLKQLERQYNAFLRNIILGQPFNVIILRGGKNEIPDNFKLFQDRIEDFKQYDKQTEGLGWSIEWKNINKFNKQIWPDKITIDTEEDFLHLLKKKNEVALFRSLLDDLINRKPELVNWFALKPSIILELKDKWKDLLAVIDYLLMHDVKQHYLRSIPVPVHTKFIEQNETTLLSILKYLSNDTSSCKDIEEYLQLQKMPFLFPVKWLDKALAHSYTSGIEIMSISIESFKNFNKSIKRIILVENQTNLYLLPAMKNTLAVFSWGKALSLFQEITLFRDVELLYWGDLDEDGFCMLNNLRKYNPRAQSIFMDVETIRLHEKRTQHKYKVEALSLLTKEEQAAFDLLFPDGRIEQEQLRQDYIQDVLERIINR